MTIQSVVNMWDSSRSWWAGQTAVFLWNLPGEGCWQQTGSPGCCWVEGSMGMASRKGFGSSLSLLHLNGQCNLRKGRGPGLGQALSSLSELPLSSRRSAWDLLNEAKLGIVLTECLSWNTLNKIVVFLCSLIIPLETSWDQSHEYILSLLKACLKTGTYKQQSMKTWHWYTEPHCTGHNIDVCWIFTALKQQFI